jgi:hypothetical protein
VECQFSEQTRRENAAVGVFILCPLTGFFDCGGDLLPQSEKTIRVGVKVLLIVPKPATRTATARN